MDLVSSTLPIRGVNELARGEKIGICEGCLRGGIVASASFYTPLGKYPKKIIKVRRRKNKGTGLVEQIAVRVNDSKLFCRLCRNNTPVRLPSLRLKRIAPTRIQRWQQCPEGDLRDHDLVLRRDNSPTVDLFIGDLVHKIAYSYAKRGTNTPDRRRHQVAEKVGAAFADPQIVGKVPKSLIGKESSITNYVHLMIEYMIEQGLVRKMSQWRQLGAQSLQFVESELKFKVPLSQLVKHFQGTLRANSLRFDALVNGSIDRFSYFSDYPGYDGPIAIISDYKTFWPNNKDQQLEVVTSYEKSLQLRTYALWASWAFNIPLVNILMQPIFVVVGQHQVPTYRFSLIEKVRLDQIDQTLTPFEQYAEFLYQVEASKPRAKMQGESLLPYYPARLNPGCVRCPAYKACTLTSDPRTDDPRSNLPEIDAAIKYEQLNLHL